MIIAVDFDGTIVEHDYPRIGKPIPFAIEVLRRLQETGRHTFLLWTVREGDLLQEALDYCSKNGVEFYAANKNYPEEEDGESPRKLMADVFIDDKNIGGLPDWVNIYNAIMSDSLYFEDIDDYTSEANRPKKKKNFLSRLGDALDTAQKYR